MENTHQERLKEFFQTYPNETACVLFTDGQIFLEKHLAYAKDYHSQSGVAYQVVAKEGTVEVIEEDKSLNEMTVASLKELATSLGIDFAKKATKQELIDAIEAVQNETEYKPVTEE